MHIIGKDTFVIETRVPVNAKTKRVWNKEHARMEIVPDGEPEYEYMWFCGMGAHPTNPNVLGAVWSPYPSQGHQYKNKDEADAVNEIILGKQAGGYVLSWKKCHKAEGRQIVVPIDAAVAKAVSKSGIDGAELKG